MLALKSYEFANGFSVLSADELFLINGGSDNCNNAGNSAYTIPAKTDAGENPGQRDPKRDLNPIEKWIVSILGPLYSD